MSKLPFELGIGPICSYEYVYAYFSYSHYCHLSFLQYRSLLFLLNISSTCIIIIITCLIVVSRLLDDGWEIHPDDRPSLNRRQDKRYHSIKCDNCNNRGHLRSACTKPVVSDWLTDQPANWLIDLLTSLTYWLTNLSTDQLAAWPTDHQLNDQPCLSLATLFWFGIPELPIG